MDIAVENIFLGSYADGGLVINIVDEGAVVVDPTLDDEFARIAD